MNYAIIFFCSLAYDFIGSPYAKFNSNAIFSKYTHFVCKRFGNADIDINTPMKTYVDYTIEKGIGLYKIMLCGFCHATWLLLAYFLYNYTTLNSLIEDFGYSMIINTLFFKLKYQ